MAKLQVLIAMTLDGSIPAEDDPLLQWMRDDKDGFSYGRNVPAGSIRVIRLWISCARKTCQTHPSFIKPRSMTKKA